ncbi:thioredoxin-like domain-containing protein [Leptolyngbya boryana CZ1]|uniref:Thioredoxin-like domain-containing protein n=1 Tax=Leptolyngbya boryana CZ1 TaxID=3060204 RepID=A0AA96WSX2_LEPBY|nr:thioredoxin-like domain-containing protein [Leptolyngbya boryana]WNZ45451.1 thioredoxin-like domain-containing protein [Leptolyngbya boryana CZ1]
MLLHLRYRQKETQNKTLMVRAPEFPKNLTWLNVQRPLSLKEFRGRILLLDFWTYGCINCIHSLPDLKYLEDKYHDRLTILSIHSAKFENESSIENIRQAILRYEITHPVLVDRDFQVWESYAVRAYPTFVLIDANGRIVRTIAGEGRRELLDQLIGELVNGIEPKDIQFELEEMPILPLAFPGKVLASDRLFIADSGHHRIVVTTFEGEVLDIIGTGFSGLKDGSFDEAQFSNPQGMTIHQNVLYVADTGNHAIRCIDLEKRIVSTIAGTGNQSKTIYPHGGKALEVDLNSPWDLVWSGDRLFIAMAGAHQIWEMQDDVIQTFAGTGAEASFDGAIQEAAFAQPSGITTNGKELWIADSETSSIRSIDLETSQVKTVCGGGDLYNFGDVDSIGETARLQHCLDVEFAEQLWIADTYNHKIKRVNSDGFCQTVFTESFSEPSGISATAMHLFIADTNHHAIRKIDLKTLEISSIDFPTLCAPAVCFPH